MGLFDIFNDDNAQAAAASQREGIKAGYAKASDALSQGRDALTTNFTAGLLPFQQNYNVSSGTLKAGTDALGNALGINGAEGNAAATAAFQNSPGYTAAVNAASENVLRNRARTGDVRSGATNIDLSNVAQNLQNTQWQQYVQNLLPFTQLGQQGSQAAASGIGALNSGLGTALSSNYGSLADLGYSSETGIGNANANAALAGNAASGNFVNALMGIAGLGSSSVGGSALSGLGGFIFSDARVKDDIEPVGEMFDGTNIYRYRYKGDPSNRAHIGVLAQEVEASNPDAVREFGGVKAVDYGKATEFAAGLAHMLEAA
jgi:hypothetical protein